MGKITHGMRQTKTYRSWINMKSRVNNKNNPAYKNYGGRGIRVCDRWLNSFENFLEDMGEKPEKLTLDRINNNGDYCKKNCHWITYKTQARNKRNNKLYRYNGKKMILADIAKKINIDKRVLYDRLNKLGWDVKTTFNTHVRRIKAYYV